MRRLNMATLHLLTVREVQSLTNGTYADGGGLFLRVRDNVARFVFRYTSPAGERREMGFGAAYRGSAAQAGQSLTAARELAGRARAQLQNGLDPIDERDRLREAARAERQQQKRAEIEQHARQRECEENTLAKHAREYHARVIEPTRTERHSAQWISSLELHVPEQIWNAPITAITAPQLLDFLLELRGKVPETASRVRQRLEAVFEDAIFRGVCLTNPAAATQRKLQETRVRRKVTPLRALEYADAPDMMRRVRAAEGLAARCLELALLTAARTSEAITAEWPEFDLEAGLWTIPASKMKADEAHQVFLSARAIEVVRGQLGLHERLLFPSPNMRCRDAGKCISNMSMLVMLDRIGMRERTTVHGLCRATFSTWANETAAARPDVIEACLAHREADLVRKAYNRAKFTGERRALMQAWADFLATPAKLRAVA
jgi:integrase